MYTIINQFKKFSAETEVGHVTDSDPHHALTKITHIKKYCIILLNSQNISIWLKNPQTLTEQNYRCLSFHKLMRKGAKAHKKQFKKKKKKKK